MEHSAIKNEVKRGRPRLPPDNRKIPHFFCATKQEKSRIVEKARRSGLTLSAYIVRELASENQ